ncbi:hypothetical protein HY503_01345 [Candidatus Woesebacteria bacterium]|nr:hypothetical protein [Candidatus Woesebacteria bacterium]
MPKKPKKDTLWKKLVLILLIVSGVWYLRGGRKPSEVTRKAPKEEVTQLSSVEKYVGMANATRSFDGKTFYLTITAFLSAPPKGSSYYLRLTDDVDGSSFVVGKLEAKGDVYTLSYSAKKNLNPYRTVVVTEATETEAKEGKTGRELLRGSF